MNTDTIELEDGRSIYFCVEKSMWHWCVYQYTKPENATVFVKSFVEWYFTKYFAQRRADSLYKHYLKLNEKMVFERRYQAHLKAITEKEE